MKQLIFLTSLNTENAPREISRGAFSVFTSLQLLYNLYQLFSEAY